ncbi:hypothetical protein GQ457_01G002630 [Hibiscus cannabinus]
MGTAMCRCGSDLNPSKHPKQWQLFSLCLATEKKKEVSTILFNLSLDSSTSLPKFSPQISLCLSVFSNPNLLNHRITSISNTFSGIFPQNRIWVLISFFSKNLILRLVHYVKLHC